MTNLKIFNERPEYVFAGDETNTVLIWRDTAEIDGETIDCLHTAESMESGEIVEHLIYNWPMPTDGAEYDEMIDDISANEPYAIELI